MNLLHLKYAVEVAETGSINKAAEKLLIGQPNLSRAVKELEASLNIKIFERTPKGMFLTSDGKIFITHAKNILKQVDKIEETFKKDSTDKTQLLISVIPSSCVLDVFFSFAESLSYEEKTDILYEEASLPQTIKNVSQKNYNLGVIRYNKESSSHYEAIFAEKYLSYDVLAEFKPLITVCKDSSLALKEVISAKDLKNLTEIANTDIYPSSLSQPDDKETILNFSDKHIFICGVENQFKLLCQDKKSYMWTAPMQKHTLEKYGLIQKSCNINDNVYKEVLIYSKDRTLSNLEETFIKKLKDAVHSCLNTQKNT